MTLTAHLEPASESTEKDPFLVDPVRPLWMAIPLSVLLLPLTVLGFLLLLVTASTILPFYRNRTLAVRDHLSRIIIVTLMATARFKISVIDHNASRDQHSQLYVAPHICMLEAMMLIRIVGHIRPMTAEFTKNLPVFGRFVDASDPIYVKRGKGEQKVSVVDLLRESIETTPYRHLVFPEGTFTNGKTLIQFKSGAFVLGTPVTPIVFTYPAYTPFWNRDEANFPMQIFRLISRFYTPVTLEFLPTYVPSEEEIEDPKLYAENVRKVISTASNRPLSKLSLIDSPNYHQRDR